MIHKLPLSKIIALQIYYLEYIKHKTVTRDILLNHLNKKYEECEVNSALANLVNSCMTVRPDGSYHICKLIAPRLQALYERVGVVAYSMLMFPLLGEFL